MQLKICTLRAFVSVKISPLQQFFWMFPSFCQMNVKSWKGCLGLTESAPLLTVIKAASSRSHLPKISLVSVFWAAPRALTLELKTICLRCRITSRWCFFVPLGGIIFQLLSYLHEAVFVLALSVLCSVFFRSFCLFWWTVELQHFMVSDISELCLISVCWHIIIMLVAEEAAGCTSWLWSHRVQRHGFSSAQNWVGGVCQTSGWSRLENTEELQPATAAKAISNSRKVFFFFIVSGHRCYIVNKS